MLNEVEMGSEYIGELRIKNHFKNFEYFGKARNLVRNFIGILGLSQVILVNIIKQEINAYSYNFASKLK